MTDRAARPNDAALASAFLSLEPTVADLRNMTSLMETAVDDTLGMRGGHHVDAVARDAPWTKHYRVLVLTEDQADGLEFAIRHLGSLTRALHRAYYAEFEGDAA